MVVRWELQAPVPSAGRPYGTKRHEMSDPNTARTDRTRPEPDAHRRSLRARRWAAVVAVARAVLIAAGLVTAYYLLPLDERRTAGASALLVCGLVVVLLVF